MEQRMAIKPHMQFGRWHLPHWEREQYYTFTVKKQLILRSPDASDTMLDCSPGKTAFDHQQN